METTFKIENKVIYTADAVATVVANKDGTFQIHVSKSRYACGETVVPITCQTREEFAKELVKILFGEDGNKFKKFTKEELNF